MFGLFRALAGCCANPCWFSACRRLARARQSTPWDMAQLRVTAAVFDWHYGELPRRGSMLPVRVVVHLSHGSAHSPVPPPHTGPAVYAAFLKALRDVDPASAELIHDRRRHKPIAVTPLIDHDGRLAAAGSNGVRFEIGVLTDQMTAMVLVALKGVDLIRVARLCCVDRSPTGSGRIGW